MLCSRNLLGIPLRKLGEDVKRVGWSFAPKASICWLLRMVLLILRISLVRTSVVLFCAKFLPLVLARGNGRTLPTF